MPEQFEDTFCDESQQWNSLISSPGGRHQCNHANTNYLSQTLEQNISAQKTRRLHGLLVKSNPAPTPVRLKRLGPSDGRQAAPAFQWIRWRFADFGVRG